MAVCRSKAEGGRRCPGGPAAAPAGLTATVAPQEDRRAAARRRWAEAERGLQAAKEALGPAPGNPSYLLTGPLARQMAHARGGGDAAVYDSQVAEGRTLLIGMLRGRGDAAAAAEAKADALAAAYATWSETPERQPR